MKSMKLLPSILLLGQIFIIRATYYTTKKTELSSHGSVHSGTKMMGSRLRKQITRILSKEEYDNSLDPCFCRN